MKKLIPIILITFLCVGNLAYAGFSDKDKKKWDEGFKRIETQKYNYKKRKQKQYEADRQKRLQREVKRKKKE